MLEIAYIVLITSTALVMGNEFSVAFFIHPSLTHAGHQRFIPAIQVFARLFGRVMPLWMTGTLILHLVLAWAGWTSHHKAALLTLYAATVWIIVAVFSVIFPVPINTKVGKWDPSALPSNWESERRRWDQYNLIRVVMIGIAFVLLLLAFRGLA